MKKAISLLFLCFLLPFNHFANEDQLPSETWRLIEQAHRLDPLLKWEYDVYVKLRGNFTPQDSAMVINALDELNQLTETINISMSPHDRGNLELFFIDSTNARGYETIIFIPDSLVGFADIHHIWRDGYKQRRSFYLGLRTQEIPDTIREEFITHLLAWAMYPTHLSNDSTFIVKDILSVIYTPDFDEHLNRHVLPGKHIYWPRWLQSYSQGLLMWPLILILFLFSGLFVALYQKLFVRIRHPFLRFNAVSLLGLLVFGILISLFIELDYRLGEFNESSFSWFSIVAGSLITISLGLPAINILRLVEIYISRKTKRKYLQSLMLFLSVSLIPNFTFWAIVYFIEGDPIRNENLLSVIIGFLIIFSVIGIIRALINYFVLNEKEIRTENELQVSRLRELKTKAELNALHSKINPHFLYNALNSIAGLSKISAEKTEHMALMLSKLFRHSINREQTDWSALGEEINTVNIYLEIEKVRFDDRLEYIVELPDELAMEPVPRFIIQPLVENAIKHGVSHLVEKGVVKVVAQKSDEWLEIAVADNGPDFPDDLIPGFGLQGIYDKLEILYPNRFELHFHNSPQKQIVLKLS